MARASALQCRFAFLIEEWGLRRLRAELVARSAAPSFPGPDMRSSTHADHLGVSCKQEGLMAVGLCIPTGRVNPDQARRARAFV